MAVLKFGKFSLTKNSNSKNNLNSMKQLTQKLGSGEMSVQELPIPQISKGMVLVKNGFSIISAGTEGSTVSTARMSIIGKAKEHPKQVKQVFDGLRKRGPIPTYRAVMKKLDGYSPLGYSCSGEVIEVGEGVTEFKVGDKVACAGTGYANHAEVVAVPINLCVKLSNNANLKDSAYNTLGAIAIQGVRQADMRLGESCVVIGLGLIGQLTCLILKASGINVIGVDISEEAVELAIENNAVDLGILRNDAGIEGRIVAATHGEGADTVIIAAATTSTDPINFAGLIARKKGKVVVLGAVPTGFDRNPYWYRKELELKMACSYGPGRYDLNYEEKGIDYPFAYVRWTEKRNMEAFQHLLGSKIIKIAYLTTHTFKFKDASKAYDLVVKKTEPFIGIALEYDFSKVQKKKKVITNGKKPEGKIWISFIGAGSYAQGNLLPNIPKTELITRIGVLTNSGTSSKRVAEKFGFNFSAAKEEEVLDSQTNTLFIATRHDSHAKYVLKGLKKGKHIFVEKPLCLNVEELEEIRDIYNQINTHKLAARLMVGYNRRFAPHIKKIKSNLYENHPVAINYRINSGFIAHEHWSQDKSIGGGRIIGEVCHFIDLALFISGSEPHSLYANVLPDSHNLNESLNISLKFKNGSIANISYFSNGSKELSKEHLEVYCNGQVFVVDDFKTFHHYGKSHKKEKLFNQDKGHKKEVESFLESIKYGLDTPIPFNQIYYSSKASFDTISSIKNNKIIRY